jgi:hypothetical protein
VEALNKAYGARGVSFYYVLSREPHPGFYGFTQTDSLEQRKEYVRLANAELQIELPWIIDDMENTMQKTYGRMPNPEFVIDSDGKVLISREWANPTKLKEFLEERIGPSGISDEEWTELGKRDKTMMAIGDNDEVPATEVPRPSLHNLELKRLDKGETLPFTFKVSTLPPNITAAGQSRLYVTITPTTDSDISFGSAEQITVELSDVRGIEPIKDKLLAGKRRKGKDVYPHTLGVLWTLKGSAARMEFKATVSALVKKGEAEPTKITAQYLVSGNIPEPTVIADEISADQVSMSSQLIPLKSTATGAEAVPMKVEAKLDKENKLIYLYLKVDKATGHKWNNLSSPPQVALKSVSGLVLDKKILHCAQHDGEDDADDRILTVRYAAETGDKDLVFEVTPEAWICNDGLGWCRIFAETYRISGKL